MTRRPTRRTARAAAHSPDQTLDTHPQPAAPELPARAAIIEIDPRLTGGFMVDRFDIIIRGRVVSTSPGQEITLICAGEPVSVASYGAPEQAARMVMPGGAPGYQRTFQFTLSRVREQAFGACPVVVSVRTADEVSYQEAFVLMIDPNAVNPITLSDGPAQPLNGDAGIRPPIITYTERATLNDDGVLLVQGWTIGLTKTVAVQLFIDGHRVAAAMLGGRRDDVAYAYPAYPNSMMSGFAATTMLHGAVREAARVLVRATSHLGFVYEVLVPIERIAVSVAPPPALEPVEPAAPQAINMFCDVVSLSEDGLLTLSGWAVSGATIASVLIYLDNALVGEADLRHPRSDVGDAFPDIPSAMHAGFRFERRVATEGNPDSQVRILARAADGAERDETLAVGPLLPRAGFVETLEEAPAYDHGADPSRFRFELDTPKVAGGVATEIVTGRLTIQGWVLARSGVSGIEVFLDGQRLGEAHHGMARQDVAGAFPEWDNALRSGYAFQCPPRSLRDGEHTVQLVVKANDAAEHRESFTITVQKAETTDEGGSIRRRVTRTEADLFDALMTELVTAGAPGRPRVMLYLRDDGAAAAEALAATLNAMRLQCYGRWHLTVLCEAGAASPALDDAIAGFGGTLGDRISILRPADPAWSQPLGGAELIGLLCPGDELGSDALAEFALASMMHPAAGLLYADEARQSPATRELEPFFKPDFSPDLLLATNYIGRPVLVRDAVMQALAITPAGLAVDGEYDLVLRACEQAGSVQHIAKLLAQRGPVSLDQAGQAEAALRRAILRRAIDAEVLPAAVDGTWRIKRATAGRAKVSIIIPTCAAHGYIETCINTLRARTTYPNYEIVVVDNIPESQLAWKIWLQRHADTVVDMPDAFNWSRFNNRAVDASDGEYLLFLNDDIEIIQDDWLDVLMGDAERPEVGIVGARLLYPDRKVQHAGMFLAGNGIGRHAFRFAPHDEPGYFGLALTQRNVIAVTGACMLVKRADFDRLGRFDEMHEIVNNDLDFCLRTHQAGLLTVVTPHATLIHHELASRANLKDVFNLPHFHASWKTAFAAGDPYFNPNLSSHEDDIRPDDELPAVIHAGYPMLRPDEIQRILVVKLDHIGDFVTALPAIRQLKSLFPHAELTVLAGPASRAFATMEPAIDAFIEFSFFHARSQLGERELSEADFAELAARLRPHRFDLAVDLRKHPSTRDVLRHTGARYLAGMDHLGQFPFLDIVLEWDGDLALQRKRGHVIDDLMTLVARIGIAAGTDRQVIQPRPVSRDLDVVPLAARRLFDKPVVAIHAGAGNITKQWPEQHFSALIDLLIERNDVNVLIVGGSDEQELSETLAAGVLNKESVVSIAGQTGLRALPLILAACTLYIGNDSGPKHIAAGLGIPTIGIHSGVVDATEWGPVGPRAVALQRNMTCSPCYLTHASDCPRDLACLKMLEPAHVHRMAGMMLARPQAGRLVLAEPAAAPAPEEPETRLPDLEPALVVDRSPRTKRKSPPRRKAR